MSFRTLIFAIPYSVFQGFSIFQSIASNTLPELQHNSQTASKCLQDTPKILPRASQDPFLEASWAPTSLSWRALGRSWALLGALGTLLERSWDALGRSWALLEALGRSWEPLGTLLSALGSLVGHSWLDLGTSQGRFWALHSYFKRFLSNPSGENSESRPQTVQERSEMIPKTKSSSAG